jgi:hypothetical protein
MFSVRNNNVRCASAAAPRMNLCRPHIAATAGCKNVLVRRRDWNKFRPVVTAEMSGVMLLSFNLSGDVMETIFVSKESESAHAEPKDEWLLLAALR